MAKSVYLIIQGHVQGVGFRIYTQRLAINHQLCGWVKNMNNGNVEIYAEGTEQNLLAFIKAVKSGPSPFSRVNHCEVEWLENIQGLRAFDIKY